MSTFDDFKRHLQDKALNFFLRVKYVNGENIRGKLQDFYSTKRDSALEMWNTINCEEQTSEMHSNI